MRYYLLVKSCNYTYLAIVIVAIKVSNNWSIVEQRIPTHHYTNMVFHLHRQPSKCYNSFYTEKPRAANAKLMKDAKVIQIEPLTPKIKIIPLK